MFRFPRMLEWFGLEVSESLGRRLNTVPVCTAGSPPVGTLPVITEGGSVTVMSVEDEQRRWLKDAEFDVGLYCMADTLCRILPDYITFMNCLGQSSSVHSDVYNSDFLDMVTTTCKAPSDGGCIVPFTDRSANAQVDLLNCLISLPKSPLMTPSSDLYTAPWLDSVGCPNLSILDASMKVNGALSGGAMAQTICPACSLQFQTLMNNMLDAVDEDGSGGQSNCFSDSGRRRLRRLGSGNINNTGGTGDSTPPSMGGASGTASAGIVVTPPAIVSESGDLPPIDIDYTPSDITIYNGVVVDGKTGDSQQLTSESAKSQGPKQNPVTDGSVSEELAGAGMFARAALRLLCSYEDPTPDDVGTDRVYCVDTLQAVCDARGVDITMSDATGSTGYMTPVSTAVSSLCPSATNNVLLNGGCCAREILAAKLPATSEPSFWPQAAKQCGLVLDGSTNTGYVGFCGNAAGVTPATSVSYKLRIKQGDLCTNDVGLAQVIQTFAALGGLQEDAITVVSCESVTNVRTRQLQTTQTSSVDVTMACTAITPSEQQALTTTDAKVASGEMDAAVTTSLQLSAGSSKTSPATDQTASRASAGGSSGSGTLYPAFTSIAGVFATLAALIL